MIIPKLKVDWPDFSVPTAEELDRMSFRAVRKATFKVRRRMVADLKTGRAGGRRLEPLSRVRRERLLERTKKRRVLKSGRRGKLPKLRASRKAKPVGRLAAATRVKQDEPRGSCRVGWINPSARKYALGVQSGKWGPKGGFYFSGDQPITPRMRRFWAAAGIILPKHKRHLKRHKRPAMEMVERAESPRVVSQVRGDVFKALDNHKGTQRSRSLK